MHIAVVKLRSVSPYSQSKVIREDKKDKESSKDFELRTWRERISCDADGNCFIPPMAFKNCIASAAKYLALQIPGKGKATYTKHFEAGILVAEPMAMGVKKEAVDGEWMFVPASGKRGDGKRVWKCFPVFPQWWGEVAFHILDDTITKEVFEQVLEEAGKFIGIGRFRPINNGYYGRFSVESVEWS